MKKKTCRPCVFYRFRRTKKKICCRSLANRTRRHRRACSLGGYFKLIIRRWK